MNTCPTCDYPRADSTYSSNSDTYSVCCPRCGVFKIAGSAFQQARDVATNSKWLLSAWIRNNTNTPLICNEHLDNALSSKKPKLIERGFLLYKFLLEKFSHTDFSSHQLLTSEPGIPEDFTFTHPTGISIARAVSYSESDAEVDVLLNQILCDELGFLSKNNYKYTFRAKGLLWNEGYTDLKSRTGFVAMWFGGDRRQAEMQRVYELGFKKGAQNAHLDVTRVDYQEYNGKIIDQIESEIKRAPFVIADLTQHRGGVYYEAGLAAGLGIPVIWTCEDEPNETNNIHFDIQPYNQIRWKMNNLDELSNRIRLRLENTVVSKQQ